MLLIKIVNDGTGTPDNGNYRYQVLCTDDPHSEKLTLLAEGEVKDHPRSTGWHVLLKKMADTAVRDKETAELLKFMQIYDRVKFEGET